MMATERLRHPFICCYSHSRVLIGDKLERHRPPQKCPVAPLYGREDYGDYSGSIEEGERFDRYGVEHGRY